MHEKRGKLALHDTVRWFRLYPFLGPRGTRPGNAGGRSILGEFSMLKLGGTVVMTLLRPLGTRRRARKIHLEGNHTRQSAGMSLCGQAGASHSNYRSS